LAVLDQNLARAVFRLIYALGIKCHDIGYTEKCHDIGYIYDQDGGKSYGRSP
jgi:hypothetical protein